MCKRNRGNRSKVEMARPQNVQDLTKDAHEKYSEKYLAILEEYKKHIGNSLKQKHILKNWFIACLCLVMIAMLGMCGCIAKKSFTVFDTVISASMPLSGQTDQNSSPDSNGQVSVGTTAGNNLSAHGDGKQNVQSVDSFMQVTVAVIGAISALISAFTSMVVAVLNLPKIVAEYLFDKNEDDNMTQIIKGIQTYEVECEKLRLCGQSDGALASALAGAEQDDALSDVPRRDEPKAEPPNPAEPKNA